MTRQPAGAGSTPKAAKANYSAARIIAWVSFPQLRRWHNCANSMILFERPGGLFQAQESIKLPSAKWVQPADRKVSAAILCKCCLTTLSIATAQQAGVIGGNAGDATVKSGWHMAWHWEHIIDQKTATSEGCPFTCPHAAQVPKYHVDSWPRSKDIIFRMGTIAVSNFQTEDELKQLADKITKGLASC